MKKILTVLSVLSILSVASPLMAGGHLPEYFIQGSGGQDMSNMDNLDDGDVRYVFEGPQVQVEWATCEQLCRMNDSCDYELRTCLASCPESNRHVEGIEK